MARSHYEITSFVDNMEELSKLIMQYDTRIYSIDCHYSNVIDAYFVSIKLK